MSRPALIVRVQVAPPPGEPRGAAVAGGAGAFLFDAMRRLAAVLGRLRRNDPRARALATINESP